MVRLLTGLILAFSLVAIPVCGATAAEPEVPAARFLLAWGTKGTEPGEFLAPHGLALNSLGHLYVVDAYNHRIQKFEVTRP